MQSWCYIFTLKKKKKKKKKKQASVNFTGCCNMLAHWYATFLLESRKFQRTLLPVHKHNTRDMGKQ